VLAAVSRPAVRFSAFLRRVVAKVNLSGRSEQREVALYAAGERGQDVPSESPSDSAGAAMETEPAQGDSSYFRSWRIPTVDRASGGV
jgi:hypothetical protein